MPRIRHVLLLALMLLLTATAVASPASAATTGGSGGPQTDRTFQSFSSGGITSNYHVYAAGLDWTKPVGRAVDDPLVHATLRRGPVG
jgi:hypothetical protein